MTDALETLKASIKALAEVKKYATLRDILCTMNAADIASLFEDMNDQVVPLLLPPAPQGAGCRYVCGDGTEDTQEMLITGVFPITN